MSKSKEEIIAEIDKFNEDISSFGYNPNTKVEIMTMTNFCNDLYECWHTDTAFELFKKILDMYKEAANEKNAMHNLIDSERKTRLHWNTREEEVD